jgi:citrate lyase subunit beta/citryl-CoA lyase
VQRRPFRSILFVPATKPEWFRKAVESGADAVVIDLEDAVPEREKNSARRAVEPGIDEIAAAGRGVFVRINPLTSTHWLEDLRSCVRPGLTGIAVPKASSDADVMCIAHVLDALESAAAIPLQTIDVQPLLETAAGIAAARTILAASPRVRSYFGGSARDGDMNRDLGSRWRPDGRETLFIRSALLLAGRAAGVPFPISGTWTEIADHDGLARLAAESRDLGYVGMYVIHPGHVKVVNDIFTPSESDIARYRAILDTYAAAERAGLGSVTLDGSMIDSAMVERAQAVLRLAEQIGADVAGRSH